jgi:UDP-N-acetylmuramate dehydrogenase
MSEIPWEEHVDLQCYNTFNVRSIARYFVRIRESTDIEALAKSSRFQSNRHLILGSGSNILFAEEKFNGIVLKNEIDGIEIISQDGSHTVLRVGGGVKWTSLVEFCIDHDLGGLENLSLIPGTVGAAPVQNIGAYGAELSDILVDVGIVDLSTGKANAMPNAACQFGYRDSIFKHSIKNAFVRFITIRLHNAVSHRLNIEYDALQQVLQGQNSSVPTIRSVSEAVCLLRRQKLPDHTILGNAGSFFKNVVADDSLCAHILGLHAEVPIFAKTSGLKVIPAAWLIEKAGWKGKRMGQVGVSSNHALVLVNFGNATGREILQVMESIVQDVNNRFGVKLVPEVQIIE